MSVAPAGEDTIGNIMSTLRKTSTTKADLKKAGIEKESEIIDQYRKLEELAKDPHSSIASKQAMIASFLKILPVEVRSKVITPLTFISRFLQVGTHTKRLNEALARAEKELTAHFRRSLIADIRAKGKPGKIGKNRVQKSTLGPEASRDLKFIKDTIADKDVAGTISKLDKSIEDKSKEELTPIVQDQLDDLESHRSILDTFGDLKAQSLDDLLFAKGVLGSIVREGRSLRRAQVEDFRAEMTPVTDMIQREISGEEVPVLETGPEKSRRKALEESLSGKTKGFAGAVENSMLSWEFLMNKLSTKSGEKVLKSFTTTKTLDIVAKATTDEITMSIESGKLMHENAMRIYGAEDKKSLSKTFLNQEKKQKGKIHTYKEDGKKIDDFVMSQMDAAYMYAIRKNEDSLPTFEAMNMTDETFREIENFIGPELKEWVDWNMNTHLQDFHFDVNAVYRTVYGANLAQTKNYISWHRDIASKVEDKGIASPGPTGVGGMTKGAFSGRVKNTNDFKLMSFNDVLIKHVDEMNNFRAWAIPTKMINYVFNNNITQQLIKQHHGSNMLKNIKQFQTDFTKSPTELRGDLPLLDKLRANITTAMTGLNPTIYLKQLTSFPAMADSIPAGEWAKGEAIFWTNPLKAWNTLKDSKAWEGRREQGMERDMRTANAVSGSQAVAGVSNWKTRSMFLVKWGDAAAILAGGYPIYKYHYDANIDSMGKEAAHNLAIFEFEKAMDRTQQASGIKDQGNFQRGGSYAKLFTMFITAPKQYTSQITAAVRGIKNDPTDGDAYKRLFIFSVLMPSMFSATANGLLGVIGGDDDDKDSFWSAQLKAIVTAPLNGIPIIRDLQNMAWETAKGNYYGTIVDLSPATQPLTSLSSAAFHGFKLLRDSTMDGELTQDQRSNELTQMLNDTWETLGYATGLPANTVRKMVLENWADVVTGETDYPFRRTLGFSRYAMGEKATRYNRNRASVKDAVKRQEDKEPRAGDVALIKLKGFLKNTESQERNLKNLKSMAKTQKQREILDKKIEKVREKFNKLLQ